jgi:phosphoribosylformylglycinamidine cyclo-ligase
VSDDALRYGSAGVDLDASNAAKNRIKKLVESTFTPGVLGGFGGFGGMFRVPPGLEKPILVSSADGVGTKIKVAIEANRHDTIGRDLVNHCVNDILAQGALPLYFLDYVAFGKLDPAVFEAVVAGVAAGCRENGCALIGGETAEMPDLYVPPDYDLAGFIVGYVEEKHIIGPQRVRPDDVLIGFPSSGLHTNGYSLARKIVKDRLKLGPGDAFPGGGGAVLLAGTQACARSRSRDGARNGWGIAGECGSSVANDSRRRDRDGQLESARCFPGTAGSGVGRTC